MRRAAFLAAALLGACGVPGPPDIPVLEGKAKAGDSRAAGELAELMGASQPPELQQAAYLALLTVGERAASEILKASRDSDAVRREHALALAGNLKLPGTYEEATRALGDKQFTRRYVAAWTLGQLADPRSAPALVTALSQEHGETARAAARALIKIGPPAVGSLLAALPGLTGEPKAAAVRVLGEIRDPAAFEPLVRALADPSVRGEAAWALGTMSRPEAFEHLVPLLQDPDWRVRVEACRSLGLLDLAEADAPLEKLRRSDPVTSVREWAARSLGLLRGQPQAYADARGNIVVPENLYR